MTTIQQQPVPPHLDAVEQPYEHILETPPRRTSPMAQRDNIPEDNTVTELPENQPPTEIEPIHSPSIHSPSIRTGSIISTIREPEYNFIMIDNWQETLKRTNSTQNKIKSSIIKEFKECRGYITRMTDSLKKLETQTHSTEKKFSSLNQDNAFKLVKDLEEQVKNNFELEKSITVLKKRNRELTDEIKTVKKWKKFICDVKTDNRLDITDLLNQ